MLELRSPLSRVLDGPGLLVHRLTAMLPQLNLRGIDAEDVFLAMAESDPDYITYLDTEGLLRRVGPRTDQERTW